MSDSPAQNDRAARATMSADSPPDSSLNEAKTLSQQSSDVATSPGSGLLINIDNGGTLTDICVIDGDRVHRTKTLTTPHDLSRCLFDGLQKVSRVIYGAEDVGALLRATEAIRYSTTQGTNALVERKGPRVGVLLGGGLTAAALRHDAHSRELFEALVGDCYESIAIESGLENAEDAAVRAVNALSARGANRIVVAIAGAQRNTIERALKRRMIRTFPPHLLGALPIVYASEITEDSSDVRRTWTAVFNAFLHPAMEQFLYHSEHRLREHRVRNPLLVFRNDGHAGRVARTIALKTYSSGPRGGMEAARALAEHYGFERLLSMDIGGTTTDIGLVDLGVVRAMTHGKVEGVPTSFPLCDVVSAGVGGSSVFHIVDGVLRVGPHSVGSTPGPACFGLGGTQATITDVFLVTGLLDPNCFFGGELPIDVHRARAAIEVNVGRALALRESDALVAMERTWVRKIADALTSCTAVTPKTVLAAFGGGGPFVACQVAEAAGISQIIIPGLAAVFSAFGIGFSDVGHSFSVPLDGHDSQSVARARAAVRELAARGMFAEGAALQDCAITEMLCIGGDTPRALPLNEDSLPTDLPAYAELTLQLIAVKPVRHASIRGAFGVGRHAAITTASRRVMVAGKFVDLPLYRVEQQTAGASGAGPAVLEEAFFTCRIDPGWNFEINEAGDILLYKEKGEPL